MTEFGTVVSPIDPATTAPRLRILHVLDHSLPHQSGYVYRTMAILRQQRAFGWETVHLTTGRQGEVTASSEEFDGVRFHRTPPLGRPFARLPVVRELAEMRATTRRLLDLAEETKPSLIHAHSPVLNALPALRVGRRLGLPVVYEVRAFWEDAAVDHGATREGSLRYRLSRGLETRALLKADAVATICQGLRREIVARGVSAHGVSVIPNGVDLADFTVDGGADLELRGRLGLTDRIVLGFIGSFYAYEGLDLLLEALARLGGDASNVVALLVGGGPCEDELRRLAQARGVGERVRFVGRVPHAEVQRYYDLVDVFVYPRHRMRLTELVTPLKPLEAMAKGRIVLASDVGGHRELIVDGETGYLFSADDADALAAAIKGVLARRDEWPDLARRARAFVERERAWPICAEGYKAIYAAALMRRANSRS